MFNLFLIFFLILCNNKPHKTNYNFLEIFSNCLQTGKLVLELKKKTIQYVLQKNEIKTYPFYLTISQEDSVGELEKMKTFFVSKNVLAKNCREWSPE